MTFAFIERCTRRIPQLRGDFCAPACSGAALQHFGYDGDREQLRLARDMRMHKRYGGVDFPTVAIAIRRRYGINAQALNGIPFADLVPLVFHGAVILGMDPAVLYDLPFGGRHAMVLDAGEVPLGFPGWITTFVPPVTLLDPHPACPTPRCRVTREIAEWAYDAAGQWALFVPDPQQN